MVVVQEASSGISLLSSPLGSKPEFLRLPASFGLMSLLLNIQGPFFFSLIFVLVIKRVFLFSLSLSVSQLLSICLRLAYPGSPGGSQEKKKRQRDLCSCRLGGAIEVLPP